MNQTGLVLEGGGMRGIYTAGVLDCFLENEVYTDAVFAVSAGGIHGLNYISKQKGRSFEIVRDYLNDPRYCSIRSLITTGDMFGADFCYNEIPNKLNIFDYETFNNSKQKLFVVCANVVTGGAEYFEIKNMKRDIGYIRASASLPLISRTLVIKGKMLLDGGICDSIPIVKSREMGYKKNIVILTRPADYRKGPNETLPLIKLRYRKYPEFIDAAKNRHIVYNETLEKLKELEKGEYTLVIRPSKPVEVSRLEKDMSKIKDLYKLGYIDGQNMIDKVIKFIEK